MRFLCLCGAYGSADKFEVQLAPLVRELSSDDTAELFFVHGPVEAHPPSGFEEFFGVGPYFRFIKPLAHEEGGKNDLLERIRNFPKGATAEDQMRSLMRGSPIPSSSSSEPESDTDSDLSLQQFASGTSTPEETSIAGALDAMEYLYAIMEEEGPFDGIIGYSEGATVAATLLLHEQRRSEREAYTPMFKCALFFAGWPPMTPDFTSIVLSDETDLTITIPTIHVIGSLDPYLAGSIALYNICDMDNAYLFDHAKGHTLPRDKETVRELGDIIRRMSEEL